MKNNLFHIKFMEELDKKIPKRARVVHFLTQLLEIEKEAVYRRLRGEVPFSLEEVAAISQNLGFSLDDLLDVASRDVSPFKLKLVKYDNPLASDVALWSQLNNLLDFVDGGITESGHATNSIPQTLYGRYHHLSRFYYFKWSYLYSEMTHPVPYKDIRFTDLMKEIDQVTVNVGEKITHTQYVLDFQILQYLINDLRYFRSVNLITPAEIMEIQTDLFSFFDYFEELTLQGKYPATGNSVQFYISNVNFDTSYSYIRTPALHISFIKAFTLNAVASFDETILLNLKHWIKSLIKSSTLITQSGEGYRIQFFNKQRDLLEELGNLV